MTDFEDMAPHEAAERLVYIREFVQNIERCWRDNPDWRFGQVVVNSFMAAAEPGDDAWLFNAHDKAFDFEAWQKRSWQNR
jgi:hypothetical protein